MLQRASKHAAAETPGALRDLLRSRRCPPLQAITASLIFPKVNGARQVHQQRDSTGTTYDRTSHLQQAHTSRISSFLLPHQLTLASFRETQRIGGHVLACPPHSTANDYTNSLRAVAMEHQQSPQSIQKPQSTVEV